MADLIDRAVILRKNCHAPAKGNCSECDWEGDSHCSCEIFGVQLANAPAVDAMECNVFRRAINRECARLCHADEEMIKAMAGYNPSSFFAGFGYALDCVVSNLTLLPRERRTDGKTD